MKRIAFLLVAAFVAVACIAQPADVDIVYSGAIPQIVVWDEVVTDENGEPILETDTISYEVFFAKSPLVEADAISLGVVTLPEVTIDLSALTRGYYYVGVRTIGETAEGAIEYSPIAWSNDPLSVDPTSRFAYLVVGVLFPASPVGLRTVGP